MGLVVFQNQVKINTFSWSKIVKISFKRKQFFIQLKRELSEDYDTLLGFNLASYRSCKNLWKSAVEHHAFFRLSSSQYSPKPKRAIFPSLSARFRQSGRARAGQQQPEPTAPAAASFSRTLPARKTLPLSLEVTNRRDASMPRLASPETSSIGSSVHSHGGKLKPSAPALVSFKRGSIDANSMTASSTSLAHRAFESLNNKVQSLSTKLPKKAWEEEPDEVDRPDRGALHSDDEGRLSLLLLSSLLMLSVFFALLTLNCRKVFECVLEIFASCALKGDSPRRVKRRRSCVFLSPCQQGHEKDE